MKKRVFFITGTDTGIGKTVFSVLLARSLRERGWRVAALKPVSSGGRADARALQEALGGALTLDEINPWHFSAPVAPAVAARRQGRRVAQEEVLAHVRVMRKRFDLVLIEGAGGLLSPLGNDFDSRDLIKTLRATPIVVCPNRLGAINQVLLVLAALPRSQSQRTQIVLVSPERPDAASRSNRQHLVERFGPARVHVLPWQTWAKRSERTRTKRSVCKAVATLVRAVGC